jgi:hypothetical protein
MFGGASQGFYSKTWHDTTINSHTLPRVERETSKPHPAVDHNQGQDRLVERHRTCDRARHPTINSANAKDIVPLQGAVLILLASARGIE